MSDLLISTTRALSPRRTIALFKDQEEAVEELSKRTGTNINVTSLVRAGMDLALRELEKALNKEESKNAKKTSKEG